MLAAPGRAAAALGRVPARARRARRPEVSDTLSLIERQIRENGITYNVYADPKGADRPWEVDPLPLAAVGRRVGSRSRPASRSAPTCSTACSPTSTAPQDAAARGAIPPPVVFGHSGFLHQVQGIQPAERHAPVPVRRRPGALARRPLVGRRATARRRHRAPAMRSRTGSSSRASSRRCSATCRCSTSRLLRRAARGAAALGAARRRAAADRAADAGPVQRDLLRACAAGALPRLRRSSRAAT